MFYPLLLSILAAVPVTPAQDPDPTIRISLSNDGQYLPGDRAKVQVIARDDGYLMVFQVNPEGRLRVLFPLDPTDDAYVKGGKRYLLLGRGGREGFTVDAPGSGAVFAAVSLDPWQFSAFVQNDHWDYAALNRAAYDDPENQLVNLAQGMAAGRFDYDILGYTVASQVATTADVAVSGGVGGGFYDACYTCDAGTTTVIINSGYSFGLYDPWYYSPYNYYGPYYPAWSYPGWGYGGYYAGYYPYYGGYPPYYGGYYPYYPGYYPPMAVPYAGYSPYQQKSWNRRWNGDPVPYRPRTFNAGYTATNTVAGQVPGIGVTQRAGFRDRTWAGSSTFAPPSAGATNVPVSKAANTSGGRRADPRPSTGTPGTRPVVTKTSNDGGAPKTPTRTRNSTWATPSTDPYTRRPEARPSRPETQRVPVLVGPPSSTFERRPQATSTPVSQTSGNIPVLRYAPGQSVGPDNPAPAAVPSSRPASSEGQKAEPVLRRREPEKQAAPAAAAPAPRQDNGNQQRSPGPDRSSSGGAVSRAPQSSPSPSSGGWGGGGGGGGGHASPGAVSGGGGGGGGRRR